MGEFEAALGRRDLVDRARGGDSAAFALLLDSLWEPAYRLAYTMLRERTAAEDAVQEAALKAWKAAPTLRDDTADLRTWFLTIVANQCRSTLRSRWWHVVRYADPPRRSAMSSGSADDNIDLGRALSRLPARDREVLALRYYLDLSVEEVALVLGITLAAAKSRLHRALRALEPVLR
jgi:RNA polymerase sigma-70 factor, ECF subfamily